MYLQVPSLVPPVLTCLIGSKLGSTTSNPLEHFSLRDLSASLIGRIAKKYAHSSHTLRPRLARTFLKCFLDPGKPLGTHYGAIVGLRSIGGGPEVIRELIVPNLNAYDVLLKEAIAEEGVRRIEAGKVMETILAVLSAFADETVITSSSGQGQEDTMEVEMADEMKTRLVSKVGEVIGGKIIADDDVKLAKVLLSEKSF